MPKEQLADEIAGHKKGRVPRALRELQLLDIAEDLFLERGYEQTSIEDICRLADVSRPVVYDVFGTKPAIYLAAVRRARAVLEQRIAAAASTTTDPQEQLARGADAYFKLLEEDPRRWDLLFGNTGAVGELAEAFTAARNRTVDAIAALLQIYAPQADPVRVTAYAQLVSGAGEQLGRWWLRNQHIPRSEIVNFHATFVWSGARDLAHPPSS